MDFTLSIDAGTIAWAGQSVPVGVTIEGIDAAGTAAISIEGAPPGAVVSFFPTSVIPIVPGEKRSMVVILALPALNSIVGTYDVRVRAVSND